MNFNHKNIEVKNYHHAIAVMINIFTSHHNRFILYFLLLMSMSSCNIGRDSTKVGEIPNSISSISPTSEIQNTSESISSESELAHEPEICSIREIYRELNNRQVMECSQITLEATQRELDFTFNLLLSLNEDRISDSVKSRLMSEQESWKEYTEQGCSRKIEAAQGKAITLSGNESSRVKFECLTRAAEQRIKVLINEVGVAPHSQSKNTSRDSEIASSSPAIVRVQDLTEGDHFFVTVPPSQARTGTVFLLARKQGDTVVGLAGEFGGAANCFRNKIISNTSVERTYPPDPFSDDPKASFETIIGNGNLGTHYQAPIELYSKIVGISNESAESVLQGCTETFAKN